MFSPHLIPAKAALTLKSLLQHQPWNKAYTLKLEETDENADIHKYVSEQLDIMERQVPNLMSGQHKVRAIFKLNS